MYGDEWRGDLPDLITLMLYSCSGGRVLELEAGGGRTQGAEMQ